MEPGGAANTFEYPSTNQSIKGEGLKNGNAGFLAVSLTVQLNNR